MPAIPLGSIAVPDDADGFPMAIISGANGSFITKVTFPAGEVSDTMGTGEVCVQNGNANRGVAFFDATLGQVATYEADDSQHIRGVTSDRTTLFYVIEETDLGPLVVKSFSKAGVPTGDVWALPSDSSPTDCFAVARDGSIFYYWQQFPNQPIHQYDLIGDAPLSDLIAGFVGETAAGLSDGFVDADGNIWAMYKGSGFTPTFETNMRQISPAGSVLQTITFTSGSPHHFAFGEDSPETFWIWLNPTAVVGTTEFRRYAVSDGALITTLSGIPTISDSSVETEAISESCPFFVLGASTVAAPGGSVLGPLLWVHWPRRTPDPVVPVEEGS